MIDEYAPGNSDLIPSEDGIDINKLGKGGTMTTDTCSTAQKLRRILVEKIPGSFDYDCMNHLRNVWFGNMEKKLTKHLNGMLRTSLDNVDPSLRVSASITAIIRAIDKEFSLSANYPKGHGELFLEWMRDKHPGELLMHVERAVGSRQDLCTEGCMAIIMNYPYYVEFLDEQLRKKEKNKKVSILQRNIFVALTSSEMIALARLLSILHLSICMPFRFLAGKTHEFKEYGWGPMSMGRVIDTLEKKLVSVVRDPRLILEEDFMMGMFEEYVQELKPLKDYVDLLYQKKQMSLISRVVARKSKSKVVHLAMLRKQLFTPDRKTEQKTRGRTIQLGKVAAEAILVELRDEKKATHKYLSRYGKEYSWRGCSEERKQALLGNKATNDEAESVLGGATAQVQRFGRVKLASGAAVSDISRNSFLNRKAPSKKDARQQGMFHDFDDVVRDAIILVAMKVGN